MAVGRTNNENLQNLVSGMRDGMNTLQIWKALATAFLHVLADTGSDSLAAKAMIREFLISDVPAGQNVEVASNIPNFDNPRIELENCMAQLEKVPSPSIKQHHAALKGDVTLICEEAKKLSETRQELQQHLREAVKVRDERLGRILENYHSNPNKLPANELSEFKKMASVFVNIQKSITTLQEKGPPTLETINKLTARTRVLLGSEESKVSQAPKLTK